MRRRPKPATIGGVAVREGGVEESRFRGQDGRRVG